MRTAPDRKPSQTVWVDYFFLCLFFLRRFLRLWVAILCFFLFLPLGIMLKCFDPLRVAPSGRRLFLFGLF
jgi:hypothetical protein